MKGSELKEILRKEGVVLMQLAEDLGMSQQNLSAAFTRDDVKSGLIEKIAKTLGKPVGYFYGEAERAASYESFSTDFIGSTDKLIDLLKVKDEQLTLAMQQTSTAQAQTDEALAQMKQLVGAVTSQPAAGALAGQAVQPVIITAPPTGKIVTTTADKLTLTKASRRAGMVAGIKGKKLTVKPKIG